MKKSILLASILLAASLGTVASVRAQSVVTPTAPAGPVKWAVGTVPWDAWFKKNTMVTDKTAYIHFFWNAQDFKVNFEVKDKKSRLAEAAIQLVSRLYPADAKADLMKVDLVYVLERDSYGDPKWDSLQQVAHLEFSRAKAKKLAPKNGPLSESVQKKVFSKFEIF